MPKHSLADFSHNIMTMRSPSPKLLDSATYFVSVFAACVLVWQVVPLDYRGGGWLIWFLISVFALILRFVLSLLLGRIRGKDVVRSEVVSSP